jgi:hypothetical protein
LSTRREIVPLAVPLSRTRGGKGIGGPLLELDAELIVDVVLVTLDVVVIIELVEAAPPEELPVDAVPFTHVFVAASHV